MARSMLGSRLHSNTCRCVYAPGRVPGCPLIAHGIAQKYEDRPLVLHTLPASKGKAPAAGGDTDTPQDTTALGAPAAEKKAKTGLHPSMATIPRLVSVVEIIKREYLKTLDPARAEAGLLSGLHQYNELGDLGEAGHGESSADAEEDRLESLARALQGRNQCVSELATTARQLTGNSQRTAEEDCVYASHALSQADPRPRGRGRHVSFGICPRRAASEGVLQLPEPGGAEAEQECASTAQEEGQGEGCRSCWW